MKRILIYGDSNTWGKKAFSGRYPETQQWPVILQQILGGNYFVIQEGLQARIAGNYNETDPYKNGHAHFEAVLRTALPVDYIIIALGTNDLKKDYGRTSKQIFDDLIWYHGTSREIVTKNTDAPCNPQIIYLGIPNIEHPEGVQTDDRVRQKVNDYLARSDEKYISLDHAEISDDGIHFTVAGHQLVAQEVFAAIRDNEAY